MAYKLLWLSFDELDVYVSEKDLIYLKKTLFVSKILCNINWFIAGESHQIVAWRSNIPPTTLYNRDLARFFSWSVLDLLYLNWKDILLKKINRFVNWNFSFLVFVIFLEKLKTSLFYFLFLRFGKLVWKNCAI